VNLQGLFMYWSMLRMMNYRLWLESDYSLVCHDFFY